MPTIAEIIAAKKAKAAAAGAPEETTTTTPAPAPRRETLAEKIELDAIDKRLAAIPALKPLVATAPRKPGGIILSKELPAGESRGQRTEIKGPDLEPERRSLSESAGEALPMTPRDADREVSTWHEALNAFESSLCVMRDPKDPEVIWLAVRPDREGLPPLLVHRLPWLLWEHPDTERPEGEPF